MVPDHQEIVYFFTILETVLPIAIFSPVGRQMAIENYVANDFLSTFAESINVFDRRLSGVFIFSRTLRYVYL